MLGTTVELDGSAKVVYRFCAALLLNAVVTLLAMRKYFLSFIHVCCSSRDELAALTVQNGEIKDYPLK